MAVMKVYSVVDMKADLFGVPFCKSAHGQAIRDFSMLVNDKDTVPGKYPADFKLVHVGFFDDMTGVLLAPEGGPVSLGIGTDFVERPSIKAVS